MNMKIRQMSIKKVRNHLIWNQWPNLTKVTVDRTVFGADRKLNMAAEASNTLGLAENLTNLLRNSMEEW